MFRTHRLRRLTVTMTETIIIMMLAIAATTALIAPPIAEKMAPYDTPGHWCPMYTGMQSLPLCRHSESYKVVKL